MHEAVAPITPRPPARGGVFDRHAGAARGHGARPGCARRKRGQRPGCAHPHPGDLLPAQRGVRPGPGAGGQRDAVLAADRRHHQLVGEARGQGAGGDPACRAARRRVRWSRRQPPGDRRREAAADADSEWCDHLPRAPADPCGRDLRRTPRGQESRPHGSDDLRAVHRRIQHTASLGPADALWRARCRNDEGLREKPDHNQRRGCASQPPPLLPAQHLHRVQPWRRLTEASSTAAT